METSLQRRVIKGWWHRFGSVVYGRLFRELRRPRRWQKCKQTAKKGPYYRFPWHHPLITQLTKIIFNHVTRTSFLSGSRQLLVRKHSVLGRKVEVSQRKIHGSLMGNSSPISIKWNSKPPKSYCQFTKRFGSHYQRNEEFYSWLQQIFMSKKTKFGGTTWFVCTKVKHI